MSAWAGPTRIQRNRQVGIPKEMLAAAKLKPFDELFLELQEDGILLVPAKRHDELIRLGRQARKRHR